MKEIFFLKKSLGQHFLKDEKIAQRIVNALSQYEYHNLLEVGPGGGALTKFLLQLPGVDFKAVELDDEKIKFLKKQFPQVEDKIIRGNFLEIEKPFTTPFGIIGNFPYNISTQILFKVLDWNDAVSFVIGMFQKEVAERAASKEGSKIYGVLSVIVQFYYKVDYLFDVSNQAFNPPPKVQSGVIRLTKLSSRLPVKSERAFKVLVKTAFNQRRKTLRNGLKSVLSKEILSDKLFNRRAETLSVKEFADLTFLMQ